MLCYEVFPVPTSYKKLNIIDTLLWKVFLIEKVLKPLSAYTRLPVCILGGASK